MIICETEFEQPDPNDPEIALTEVDYYAWIPQAADVPNHRLSLRYRFATNQYEVISEVRYDPCGGHCRAPGGRCGPYPA